MATTSAGSSRPSSIFSTACPSTAWRCCARTTQRARDHPAGGRQQIVRYGFSETANIRAENVRAEGGRMRFDCVRVNGGPTSRLSIELNLPGLPTCSTRSPRSRWPPRWVPDAAIVKQGARRVQRRRPALPALRRGRAARPGRRPAASRWSTTTATTGEMAATIAAAARRLPRPPPGAGLPAPSLHAHTRLFRGLRQGAVDRGCAAAGRGLCRRRDPIVAADGRSLARADPRRRHGRARLRPRRSPTCRA